MTHSLDFVKPGGMKLVFAGSPLDRAEDKRGDADWLAARFADPASKVIAFHDLKALVSEAPPYRPMPLSAEARAEFVDEVPRVFLGLNGDAAWFAVDLSQTLTADRIEDLHPGGGLMELRPVAIAAGDLAGDDGSTAILAQARALLDWHRRHRFCAECGVETHSLLGGALRRCGDESCGANHFPRTDPVAIMLVISGDRVLLGRQDKFPAGVYSALAGFMEPGESIEEAVRREVLEEAGVRVGEVRYFASQPWPFPSSLMIGCFAEALSDEIVVDGRELEDARWVSRGELADAIAGAGDRLRVPPAMAIAHQLIRHWLEAARNRG